MSKLPSARVKHRVEQVIPLYEKYLAEEQANTDIQPSTGGRHKEPRRRAVERVAQELGYANWTSVQSVVARWLEAKTPTIETFGVVPKDSFIEGVKLIQSSVRKVLGACDDIEEAAEQLDSLDTGDRVAECLSGIREAMGDELPNYLCPYCKSVVPGCTACEGEGWENELDDSIDKRLVHPTVAHVLVMGKVVKMDEWKARK